MFWGLGMRRDTYLPSRNLRIEVLNVVVLVFLIGWRRIQHIYGTDGNVSSIIGLRLRDLRSFIETTRNLREFALHANDDVGTYMSFLYCICEKMGLSKGWHLKGAGRL